MGAYRFLKHVYRDDRMRLRSERRRVATDLAYYARNRSLIPLERILRHRYREARYPLVFIVGVPRSGTTLLYQLIARHLRVAYVNNRMARYWMTPIAGAVLSGRADRSQIELDSRYGAGASDMSPHEYSWFWQYYGYRGVHDDLDIDALEEIDWRSIEASLYGLAEYLQAPLVLKSLNYVNYHIPWLRQRMPTSRFIWIERDDLATAKSILGVRQTRYGDPATWWSVRPRDFEQWAEKSPEEQVAHQVMDIRAAIEGAFSFLGPASGFKTSYESLVSDPARVILELAEFLGVSVVDANSLGRLQLERRAKDGSRELETRIMHAFRSLK